MIFVNFAVCFLVLLVAQSKDISYTRPYGPRVASQSPASPGMFEKRSTSHSSPPIVQSSWWRWSSADGYTFGTGPAPSNPTTSREVTPSPKKKIPSGYSHPPAGSDAQRWLDAHNSVRARYGAPNLQWNPDLVAASKRLTDACIWKHTQNNVYGENMAAGQTTLEEVVKEWVHGPEEAESYTPSNPQYSHFTQVVWVATTEVGCYQTSCPDVQGSGLPQSPVPFWGCNYNPAGNVIGEFADNVKAAQGGKPAV